MHFRSVQKTLKTINLTQVRQYAVKVKTNVNPQDTRNDIIRKALFDAPLREVDEFDAEELKRHEIIESAWELYSSNKRAEHQAQLNSKYLRMQQAANKLSELNEELYKASQVANHSLLFPKQMKIPTETPANVIWNKVATKSIPAPTLKANYQL